MLRLIALAMPLNFTSPTIWSQLDVTIVRSPPSDNLNNHLSPYCWYEKYVLFIVEEPAHTAATQRSQPLPFISTTAKQRVTSTGDPVNDTIPSACTLLS